MIENYIFDLYGTLVDIRTDESTSSFWRRMALFLSLQSAAYGPEELRLSYLSAELLCLIHILRDKLYRV